MSNEYFLWCFLTFSLTTHALSLSLSRTHLAPKKVFVTLEKPGLNDTEFALRENVTEARQTFIDDVIYSMSTNSLSEANLNEMLELYERKAQEAVEGDLMLVSDDKNGSSFPSKGEKWTMLQAIFFASTVCTTIGECHEQQRVESWTWTWRTQKIDGVCRIR